MIRVAHAQDAVHIRDIYAPHVLTSTASFEVEVPSLATMEQRITDTLATHPWLVHVSAEGVRGYAYATTAPHPNGLPGVDRRIGVRP